MKRNPLSMSQDPAHNWQAANGGKRALGKHAGYQERDNSENETAFVRDCRTFNEGKSTVNPYVGNMTCYGVPYNRVAALLTANGVFHPVYNPEPVKA